MSAPARPADLAALAEYSAKIGADPLLIQAAGGNSSVKSGDVMWIKASGTVLADAMRRDIFVPCDLPKMRAALAAQSAIADQPQEFLLQEGGLRPSIETSLHAVFPQPVVVHVHCVHTLCMAIQADPLAAIGTALDHFSWGYVPYAKPGANLAAQVAGLVGGGEVDVIVLGNHGLIVAAETVGEVASLLAAVHEALRPKQAPLTGPTEMPDLPKGWQPAPDSLIRLGKSEDLTALASAGSLYPDHVIFCGVAMRAVPSVADLPDPTDPDTPPAILIQGQGAALRADASAGARALAQCLGDVLGRTAPDARLHYLSAAQNMELLDWDAEKYRQALNA